jgi:hypothetical protein
MEQLCQQKIEYNGKEQAIMVLGDDVVKGVVVTAADYDTDSKGNPMVKVQLSSEPEQAITANSFKIIGQDGNVGITNVVKMQATYYLYLDSSNVYPGTNYYNKSGGFAIRCTLGS